MNPLDQLADIHLPPQIGVWPLAWGWWLIIILVIASITSIIYWRYSFVKKNAYRKQALRELAALTKATEASQEFIQAANQILHRCALYQPQKNVALVGEPWVNWLDQQCKPAHQQFSNGIGRVLITGPYQANFTLNKSDQQALYDLLIVWIKKHQFVRTVVEQKSNV